MRTLSAEVKLGLDFIFDPKNTEQWEYNVETTGYDHVLTNISMRRFREIDNDKEYFVYQLMFHQIDVGGKSLARVNRITLRKEDEYHDKADGTYARIHNRCDSEERALRDLATTFRKSGVI